MGKDGRKGRRGVAGAAAESGLPIQAQQGQPRALPYTHQRDLPTPGAKPSVPLNKALRLYDVLVTGTPPSSCSGLSGPESKPRNGSGRHLRASLYSPMPSSVGAVSLQSPQHHLESTRLVPWPRLDAEPGRSSRAHLCHHSYRPLVPQAWLSSTCRSEVAFLWIPGVGALQKCLVWGPIWPTSQRAPAPLPCSGREPASTPGFVQTCTGYVWSPGWVVAHADTEPRGRVTLSRSEQAPGR